MIIPFDIKYRQDILDGKARVVNEHGDKVYKIICWDVDMYYPIVAVNAGVVRQYSKEGRCYNTGQSNLYILLPDVKKGCNDGSVKQDYSGLTALEQAIHRGFLCAGVENVSVDIIKETAIDVLAEVQTHKEDEGEYKNKVDSIIESLTIPADQNPAIAPIYKQDISWLEDYKNRVLWRPTKSQKESLLWCVVHLGGADKQTLGELLEQLNKL